MSSESKKPTQFQVTSEIYSGCQVDNLAKPQVSANNIVTNFTFRIPEALIAANKKRKSHIDEDGDLIVPRRNREHAEGIIAIEQSSSTPLELVGLQVWRGALALADFLLYKGPTLLENQVVLELGSGTGLTSIVAAMLAKEVICTDVDIGEILNLIRANFSRNSTHAKAKFSVLGLDFFAAQWSPALERKMKEVTVVLVADVIYDDHLTEAFVKTLQKILNHPPRKDVYIALEKRYVFTVADLDCGAPCYEHFLQCLEKAEASCSSRKWCTEEIPVNFPQFFNYERVKELVLWKISSE